MTRGSERGGLAFAGLCALSGAFAAPVARLTTERGAIRSSSRPRPRASRASQQWSCWRARGSSGRWCRAPTQPGLGLIAVGVFAFVRAPHAVETRERIPTATAPLGVAAGDEAGGDAA